MIKAIILDDEQPSGDKLARLLKESGMVEVTAKFTRPLEALTFLQINRVDVVFLDIEMPDIDGIEMANRIIDLRGRIAIVFVTAYNQYAVEAFRLNALDYLMKPVTSERLKETLHRIIGEKDIDTNPEGVRIQCFGRFRVLSGSCEVKFRTGKAEELLAFLIDRRGGFVSRREIIDCLWEDFEGDKALVHFNTTLHYVKKALLQYGFQLPIVYDRGGYRLDTEGIGCDYLRFRTFVENVKAAGQKNILEYEDAAGLYMGEYLSGWEYDWVERKRQWLEERFINLLLAMAEYYQRAGEYPKALKWLQAGLVREPLHRELNYRLIEILLLTNERVLAVRYYDIYRNGLRKKLQQEPDEAFGKLLRQV